MGIGVWWGVKMNRKFEIGGESESGVGGVLLIWVIENGLKDGICGREGRFIEIWVREKEDEMDCVIGKRNYGKN